MLPKRPIPPEVAAHLHQIQRTVNQTVASLGPRPPTPQLDWYNSIEDEREDILCFLQWLREHDYEITSRFDDPTDSKILNRFFEIDEQAMEQERVVLKEWMDRKGK